MLQEEFLKIHMGLRTSFSGEAYQNMLIRKEIGALSLPIPQGQAWTICWMQRKWAVSRGRTML
jgi:hypothetical protein